MKRTLYALLLLVVLVPAGLTPPAARAMDLPLECLKLLIPGSWNHPGILTACAYQFAEHWNDWNEWGEDWPFD